MASHGVLPAIGRGLGGGALGLGVLAVAACVGAAPSSTDGSESRPTPAAIALEATQAPSSAPLPQVVKPWPTVVAGTLVFQSDVQGRPKIFSVDLQRGVVRALTTGADWRDESPRWSPDGQFVAFTSNRAHYGPQAEAGTPDLDVFVMRADGTQVRRITTDPGNDSDPSWLPDGQSLVFSSDRASRGDLYRVRLADGQTTRLTTNFVGRAIMPAVSPDGRRVAFAAQTLRVGAFWNFQVHLLDLASGRTEPVPASGGACWPAWSRDGRLLYNVQLDREPSAIQRRDLVSGAVTTAYADAARWSYYPRVSPAGQWLAISVSPEHHDGEDWDLALVSTTGPSRRVPLTTGRGNDRLPDWRP